jgi:hypothetical protein
MLAMYSFPKRFALKLNYNWDKGIFEKFGDWGYIRKYFELPGPGSFLEGEDSVPTPELWFGLSTVKRSDSLCSEF